LAVSCQYVPETLAFKPPESTSSHQFGLNSARPPRGSPVALDGPFKHLSTSSDHLLLSSGLYFSLGGRRFHQATGKVRILNPGSGAGPARPNPFCILLLVVKASISELLGISIDAFSARFNNIFTSVFPRRVSIHLGDAIHANGANLSTSGFGSVRTANPLSVL
jgi:hypothetical protein